NPPYEYTWNDKVVPVAKGSSETTTERYMENYKNVSQDIRDQQNTEAEAVHIILTGIDIDIYSIVDDCPNACEMWKSIERLKQEWQRFVTLVKKSQELKTVSYPKLYDILKQHQNEVNEIRAERLARTANPLALVAQQQPDKEIDKLMALISLSFKKIYKPTNNNLQTLSNTSRENQDNSLRISRGTGYDNQRIVNVAGAWETVGTTVVQKSRIQCYNCKEFRHVARECQKPKQANDAAYHKEKMLLCKQEDAGFQLNTEEQIDHDDDGDLANEHDLLASLIEKLKCEIDDSKNESSNNNFKEANNELSKTNQLMYKDLKKFQAELDMYHDVKYASKVEINCAKAKGDLMSYKMEFEKASNEYTRKINDLNQTILEMKKELFPHQETISIMSQQKEAQIEFHKTREDKKLDKVISLKNKVKVLDNIVYKTGQIVQIMTMLNRNCKTSFAKPEFLKKAQRANPRLYDIGCYNDNLALMLAPESDEKHAINLELDLQQCQEKIKNDISFKENQSKEFCKEREQYFEIQDLKAQLQDKGIAISELKKLIEKLKGKYVETKFEKSSVIRQPNAFKSQRPSILGKSTIFLDSLERKDCSKSKPQLKSNQIKDRFMLNNSQGKKQEVEDHHMNVKFSNNKTSVTACNDSLNAKTTNVNFVCVTCGKCVMNDKHDMCVIHSLNGVNSRTKMPMVVPISTREPKRTVNQSVAKPLRRTVSSESTNQKPRHTTRKLYEHVMKTCSWWYPRFTPPGYKWKPKSQIGNLVEIILFIVDSGCSKHMTGNLKLLTNFVEKFLGSVKFGNDQIAPILGNGDLVQGTFTIKRVYYVEGLNHNLFSVGQLCDADLEVAFQKSMCYIHDLKGNDRLTGSHGIDLYSIILQDTSSP
nr:hypothetical protein [Tanacetum cinerariifolium]